MIRMLLNQKPLLRIRKSRAVVALLVPVFVLSSVAFGELLTNPAFEDLDDNGAFGDGWSSFGTAGFHDYWGGNPHASLFSDQPSNAGGVYQVGIPGMAGYRYTFTLVSVRIEENADADFLFGLEYFDSNESTMISDVYVPMDLAETGDGLSFSMSDVAPPGTAYVRPVVRFDNVRSTESWQENVFVFEASLTAEEGPAPEPGQVSVRLTRGDQASLFQERPVLSFAAGTGSHSVKVTVDPDTRYQTIDGFGAAMTDSSAWLINDELSSSERMALLGELFSVDAGIGISMVRLPMGASDFAVTAYTYDDVAYGQTDPNLNQFSISHDQAYIIPALLTATALGDDVKIVGSPWSPPAWMKNTQSLWGGSLQSQYYSAYADYFVRFVQAYEAEGLPIYAVTPQNEPLNATTGMPACTMQTYQQSAFVGDHLGPAFAGAGLDTKILVFDHNWADWSYPVVVMNDAEAGQYAAGAAFHGYDGDVSQQSDFHAYHPEAEIHFTEISGGEWSPDFAINLMWGVRQIIIETTRNWSRSAIFWNLALDQDHGPRIGGCENCRGVVTINTNTHTITREVEYYIIGHASKFVRPGAVRIASDSLSDTVETVAFQNSDGSMVLIAVNPQYSSQWFDVVVDDESFSYRLPGQSVVTFCWETILPGDFDGNGIVDFDDVDDGDTGNWNSLYDYLGQAPPLPEHDLARDGASAGVIDAADLQVLVGEILGSYIGDLNRDQQVSFEDYAIFADHIGEAGGYYDGDLDVDGDIDLADFAVLQVMFGSGAGG